MKISAPRIVVVADKSRLQVEVELSGGVHSLWIEVDSKFRDFLSDLSDGPLVALLAIAMASGEDIHIKGSVSEKLLYNLSGPCQEVLRLLIPTLRKVSIFPEKIFCGSIARAAGVATGFSGGIDSFSALADNASDRVPAGYKLTHLLFVNSGSSAKGGRKLFHERYERLVPIVGRMGLSLIVVDSNLNDFFDGKFSYHQTHTLRNASIALMLQKGIGRFMYASAYHYRDVCIKPTDYMCCADSVSLPLLSSDQLDAISVGGDHTRVEKTLQVATLSESYHSLDVCINSQSLCGRINCSKCEKCLRTMATLEIAGLLDRYSGVFDLSLYRKHRIKFFAFILQRQDPMYGEIIDLARERGFFIPFSSRILHAIRYEPMKRILKRVRSRWQRISGNVPKANESGSLKPLRHGDGF